MCRSCEAAIGRQKHSCWRCGASTVLKHGPRSALQEIPGGAFAQRQYARRSRTPTTVPGNERATTQEQPDTERSIDEGGSLDAEAIAPPPTAASEASYRDALAARAKPTT